jgi:hypothetical protein
VVTGVIGETFDQLAFLALGFFLYLASQGVAICATTILQEEAEDAYRGRMFAFYDVAFNFMIAVGALVSVTFMPRDGKSHAVIGAVAAGYAVCAAAYWLVGVRGQSAFPPSSGPGPGSGPDSGGTDIPSSAAQRSNS